MTTVTHTASPNAQKRSPSLSASELATLRKLLMGADYEKLLKHKITLENPELLAKHIAPVLSEALTLRNTQDDSLQQILNPAITHALLDSVSKDPKPIADALYPVMGPAIRKSINMTMTQMLSNFNELLEQSVSPKAWQWRFDAWRTGRSYSEVILMNNLLFQVEQVFLIHRETGLLLQHVLSDTAISKDPDMVSGMLTAIQDFISDSFSVEENSGLNSLRLGDLTVLVEHGPSAVIAAVVRGTVPQGMQTVLSEAIETIHQYEFKHLKQYDGNPAQFEHLQPILASCLRTKRKQEPPHKSHKKTNKVLWTGISLLILGLAYSAYYYSQKNQVWIKLQQNLNSEPGLVVTQAFEKNGRYHVIGLLDPLATPPATLIQQDAFKHLPVTLDFRPYLSLDSEILLARIHKALLVPHSVQLTLQNQVLYASGHASAQWIEQFRFNAPLFAGIKQVNLNQLQENTSQ